MKKDKRLIKISLLFLIVYIGLIAVAPEWLELKNAYLGNRQPAYEAPFSEKMTDFDYKPLQILNAIKTKFSNPFSSIHHIILGPLADMKFSGIGLGILLIFPFWLLAVITLYVIFLSFALFMFRTTKKFTHKFIEKNPPILILSLAYPILFNLAILVASIILSLLIWSLILNILLLLFEAASTASGSSERLGEPGDR